MHQATHVSPSDIKPVLEVLKSILGTCPAKQTGQQITAGQLTASTTGHQQAAACQHWAELGRSADQAKNPAKSGQKQARSKGKNALLMTLCIFSEKSIIQLFHYCICTVIPNRYIKSMIFGCFSRM